MKVENLLGDLQQSLLHRAVDITTLWVVGLVVSGGWLSAPSPSLAQLPLQTTLEDFFQAGTQPETLTEPLLDSNSCAGCHGFYDAEMAPHARWVGSLMAQSTRDPIFHAALVIAEQDARSSGETCLRCHAPMGWFEGRSVPTDGSELDPQQGDFDGVSCHVCHRMVDPVYEPGVNPVEDRDILDSLELPPGASPHTGQLVLDPLDRRRGPFDLGENFLYHPWMESAFHEESLLCASCHDVSNPAFSREPDGSYRLNDLDTRHPTQEREDEFPIERTYTEWSLSVFAEAPMEMGGRFGGNKTAVSSCQDCHMPDMTGTACSPELNGEVRDDLPKHDLAGANSWVLRAVRSLYPDSETGLSAQLVEESIARNLSMLERSADLELFRRGDEGVVRIVNQSGHKLPTGYGEGRRMWIHVEILDASGQLLEELGGYDAALAVLDEESTRVYEIHHALDDYMAAETGLPSGKSFHFVLNNSVSKDNRIPPRGYDRLAFEQGQSPVVEYSYGEQHYWDEFAFDLPQGAASVRAELLHQTTSREYIEFLRDENQTNDLGQQAYDLWLEHGKSAPSFMARAELALDAASCATPIAYGLGGLHLGGQRGTLAAVGLPSRSGSGFEIAVSGGLPAAQAFLLMGYDSASVSRVEGLQLVETPRRVAAEVLDGAGGARFSVPVDRTAAGTQLFFQVAFRDAATGTSFLSDGLFVEVCE